MSTGESRRVMGVGGAVFLLQSRTISTALIALSSKLFCPDEVTRWSISHPIGILIPTSDEPNEGGVSRGLQELDGLITRGSAVGVKGKEKWIRDTAFQETGAHGQGVGDMIPHIHML